MGNESGLSDLQKQEHPERPRQREYLWTSEILLSPEVGAVEIGLLEAGKHADVKAKMEAEAAEKGIKNPLMVANLVFKEGKQSALGSAGQPYPISEQEWETFVKDVPEYCGDNVPVVYMVDGDKYTAPI